MKESKHADPSKQTKKVGLLLLAAVGVLLCLLFLSSCAGETGKLAYVVNPDEETCTVTGIGTWQGSDLVIPDTIDGYRVTGISRGALMNQTSISSLTVPEGVTWIGDSAFWGCHSLARIQLPEGLTEIGDSAFRRTRLSSVTVPASVIALGIAPFSDCPRLESITVKEENPVYHSRENCLIETEKKVLVQGCNQSKIPSDGSVRVLGEDCFRGCKGLVTLFVPEGVVTVEDTAFFDCRNLISVTLPESLSVIGDSAFHFCESLTAISIPALVTSVGDRAFASCVALESITVKEGNPVYYAEGNCLVRISDQALIVGCKESVIPPQTKKIGRHAFFECRTLTAVTVPESVTEIEDGAFYECAGLTSVTLSGSVKRIGTHAFFDCTELASLELCEGLESIDLYAFWGCTNLTEVAIPKSVMKFGSEIFLDCPRLTEIDYGGTRAEWEAIEKERSLTETEWNPGISDFTVHCTDGEKRYF